METTSRRIRVKYERAAGGDAGEGPVRDASLSSVFVETDRPLETGTLLAIEVISPSGAARVTVDARVIGVVKGEGGAGLPGGMALRFLELADGVEIELRKILDEAKGPEKTVLGIGDPTPPPPQRTIVGVGGPPQEKTALGLGAPTPEQIAEERAKAGIAEPKKEPDGEEKELSWSAIPAATAAAAAEAFKDVARQASSPGILPKEPTLEPLSDSDPGPFVPLPASGVDKVADKAISDAPKGPAPEPPPPKAPEAPPAPGAQKAAPPEVPPPSREVPPPVSARDAPPPASARDAPPPSLPAETSRISAAGVPKKGRAFRWFVVLLLLGGGGAAGYVYRAQIMERLGPYVPGTPTGTSTASTPLPLASADAEPPQQDSAPAPAEASTPAVETPQDAAVADAGKDAGKDAGADAASKDAGSKDAGKDAGKHDAGHAVVKPKPKPPPPATATATPTATATSTSTSPPGEL